MFAIGRIRLRRSAVAAVAMLAAASACLTAGMTEPASAAVIPLPAAEATSPAPVSFVAGRTDVFWTSGGTLKQQFRAPGGSWSRVLGRGGELRSQPAVVSWGPERVDVFARGADNRLKWRTRTASGWGDWKSLGGTLTSAPAVASWAAGRLDVFVRWTDNTMYQRTLVGGTWSAWRARGGVLTSSPAATSWGPGRIDVVARTTDRDLVHRRYTTSDGWSRWRNLGGTWSAQPAIASPGTGRLDVFLRGAAGRMRVTSFRLGSGWTPPKLLGDKVYTSGPGATAIGDDVKVAAQRATGFRYLATRPSPTSGWSIWRAVDMYLPLRRLGTWVDILDYPTLSPAIAVADMKARGVRTLLLSTARFNSEERFYDEAEMAAWLDEAHAVGIRVVGWYVPAYGDMDRDVARTVAIARYVSPTGQRFDAVGVDIERFGESGEVDRDTFNTLVVPHLRQVRARTTAVIVAIVPSPYATDPGNNWEGFPWAGVGSNSEVVVPMALWSFRSNPDGSAFTAAQVHDWVVDQIDRAQALTGRRVHVEGGVDDPGTEKTPVTTARVQAFVDAVADGGAIGGSHYDYATTTAALWPILAGING
ncbi:MAG TPA: hypothetical protein VFZ64_14485 [Nocardioidaceae bacterium]